MPGAVLDPAAVGELQASFGAKYARLQAVKDEYDPKNVFHNNTDIPPSG